MNNHSNEDLARQLFRRETRKPSRGKDANGTQAEPLASRREPFDAGQQSWTLGAAVTDDQAVDERERRALFAALSKGTKANLGREPTVGELLQLVNEVDKARALVASARAAIDGKIGVFLSEGELHFREPGNAGQRQGAGLSDVA